MPYTPTTYTDGVTNDVTAAKLNKGEVGTQSAQAAADTANSGLAAKAPLASPALTGTPTAPTAAAATNSTQLATTAFVIANGASGGAADASTTVKGVAKLATAPAVAADPIAVGDNDPRNTNARTPTAHGHAQADVTNLPTDLAAKAPLASPALTGTPTAPTAAAATNTTQVATTAFVIANAGSGSGVAVRDEGTLLTQRGTLNFVGAGVTATDDATNGRTVITIPGGTSNFDGGTPSGTGGTGSNFDGGTP